MSYDNTTYNKNEYKRYKRYECIENNIEMDNTDNMNNTDNMDNSWRFKPLYIDTKHFCAPKTNEILTSDKLFAQQHRPHIYPSSVPVIVKDTTRPYTYYTMKSYGQAQDNNYYVNFDDHVSTTVTSGDSDNNYSSKLQPSIDDSACAKTYLCTILGCFACCLFQMKPV